MLRQRSRLRSARARRWMQPLAIAAALAALAACSSRWAPAAVEPERRLLIAPILQGAELCQPGADAIAPHTREQLASHCLDAGKSASAAFEATLQGLGPLRSPNGRYEIGYTLPVPLLRLFRRDGSRWAIDERKVARVAQTVRETDRPVIVYLFSTHFAAEAPIEEELFAEEGNAAVSAVGPLGKDRYYGTLIYPWSFASTDNSITRRRQEVIDRLLAALCRLPQADRDKIRALTLLGELQHFHADFERGMGLGGPYIVSDYSEASVRGFRDFLAARFGSIAALNLLIGERYASFDEVLPPSLDVRVDGALPVSRHIDSFAHGRIPLVGWAHDPTITAGPVWIRVYRDGMPIARVPARFGRQDVLQARPDLGTADLGWRFDLDFTLLPPGIHRLDFLAELPGGGLTSLGSRRIVVVAAGQPTPVDSPVAELPPLVDAGRLNGYVDHPRDASTYVFNPMVPLWHEFRGAQIVRYLTHFERQIRGSCLRGVELYTHQIVPFANPSWDATKFAVDASLQAAGGLLLGVSLYGEPTYGTSFFDWLATTSHRQYGITEFHPLRAMSATEVRDMLEAHRQRGATFLSFFMSAEPESMRAPSELAIFGIEPGNRHFGSDRLHRAFREVLGE